MNNRHTDHFLAPNGRPANDANVNNNFYIHPVNNGVATGAGSDYTGYMVGLRHAF